MQILSDRREITKPLMADSDFTARLQRDVAFHRVAQLLADACACRSGVPLRGLSVMPSVEAQWYRQTARQIVEVHEQMTTGKRPDAELRADDVRKAAEASREATAIETRLAIERSVARYEAQQRGHEMGPWHVPGTALGQGEESAACVHCRRTAVINIHRDPVATGAALTQGCLAAARPDAFLADQPDAARTEDR